MSVYSQISTKKAAKIGLRFGHICCRILKLVVSVCVLKKCEIPTTEDFERRRCVTFDFCSLHGNSMVFRCFITPCQQKSYDLHLFLWQKSKMCPKPNRVLLTSIIFKNDNTQCMLCVYQIDLFLIQFNM